MNGGSILYGGQTPSHTVVSKGWGAVVVRNDTGLVEAVYRAPNPRIASYAARSQYHGGIGLRTWEEYTVGLGLPFAALMLAVVLNLPAASLMIPAIAASFGIVFAMRALAGRASTARILASGKAVTKLVVSGNDDLISAAIDPVIGLDSDPKGAAQLVNELRDVWKAAEASSANEKIGVIAALRETAANFPTTDARVDQVRRELAGLRRSLATLDAAQRELDATTSTADLADPPKPPPSLGLLRAASESISEDIEVVREVTNEQRGRRTPGAAP